MLHPRIPNLFACLLSCVLALPILNEACWSSNQLVNPGFEQGVLYDNQSYGQTNTLAGWTYSTDPESSGFWNGAETAWGGGTTVRTGSYCVRVFHYGPIYGYPDGWRNSTIHQETAVLPGTNYTASAWVYIYLEPGQTIGNQFGAGLRIEEIDSSGSVIAVRSSFLYSGTEGWRQISIPFQTASAAASVRFTLTTRWYLTETLNHINWDDCSLEGPAAAASRIPEARALPDGSFVRLENKIVSACFEGYFYVQEPDLCGGIRVNGEASPGDVVDIVGVMATVGAERAIQDATVTTLSRGAPPQPVRMANRAVFGAPSPLGLLAGLIGRVISAEAEEGSFVLDDGSGWQIKAYGAAAPGDLVQVMGVLGAEPGGIGIQLVLRTTGVGGEDEYRLPPAFGLKVACVFDPQLRQQAINESRNYWWSYISEIVDRIGIRAVFVTPAELPTRLGEFSTILLGPEEEQAFADLHGQAGIAALEQWVASGGVLIASRPQNLDALMGNTAAAEPPPPGDDFAVSGEFLLRESEFSHDIQSPLRPGPPLAMIGPVRPVVPTASQAIGQAEEGAVITARRYDSGWSIYFGFDLGQTFWVIQQGRPIDFDYDGDGYWRSGDAMVLGSREMEVPYTDILLFLLQNMVGLRPHPLIHRLPANGNEIPDAMLFYGGDDEATSGIDVTAAAFMGSRGLPYHINCMPTASGGFAIDVAEIAQIEATGGELSLHYDFISGFSHPGGFTQEDVNYQTGLFVDWFGRPPVCTVNHWTRWTGWWEPAYWMMLAGLQGDNGRFNVPLTSSNPVNNIGFAFGTAFPYFFWTDHTASNTALPFVEVPITGYELGYSGNLRDPEQVRRALLIATHYNMIFNFFYHPVYIASYASCRDAIDTLLALIAEQGKSVLHSTPDSVVRWWFDRSEIEVSQAGIQDGTLTFVAEKPSPGGFVMTIPLGDYHVVNVPYVHEVREAYGNRWLMLVLPPGQSAVEVDLAIPQ